MRYTVCAMRERERPQGGGDIRGPSRGDYTDWDNPEDEDVEEAPEGYYDEEDDDEEEVGPDDPDYDLSEAAGYADWEPASDRQFPLPQWVIVAVSLLLILALVLPALRWFG